MPGKFCFRFVKTSPNYVQDPAIIALLIKQLEFPSGRSQMPSSPVLYYAVGFGYDDMGVVD